MRPSPLPPELAGRAFTVAQARARAVPESRLRRDDLEVALRGTRVPAGTEMQPSNRIRLTSLTLPAGQAFTHLSAARLHGLWLPPRLERDPAVHVGCTDVGARRHGRGVRGHVLDADRTSVVQLDGIPTLSVVDTWVSLASMLTPEELVVLGDQLVRRQRPSATNEELAEAAALQQGRRGGRRLACAYELIRPRTDSVKESELRLRVRSWGFPEPLVNPSILDARGGFLGYGDLTWFAWRVLLEYDGGQHRTDVTQFDRDIDRLDAIAAEGWRVIRVGHRLLTHEPHRLRQTIDRALRERGWHPGR